MEKNSGGDEKKDEVEEHRNTMEEQTSLVFYINQRKKKYPSPGTHTQSRVHA